MPGLFIEDSQLDERVLSLLDQFDHGKLPPLGSRSPLLVALLLKKWLTTLAFPIFPPQCFEQLMQAHGEPE